MSQSPSPRRQPLPLPPLSPPVPRPVIPVTPVPVPNSTGVFNELRKNWILACAVAILFIGAGVLVIYQVKSHELPPRVTEEKSQKHRDTQTAFEAKSPLLSDAEETGRIKKCVDLYTAGMASHDSAKFRESFDFDRLYDEIERQHVLDNLSAEARSQFKDGLALGMSQSVNQTSGPQVIRRDIKRVNFSSDRREAVIYTRDSMTGNVHIKSRFWLRRTGSKWRIFDLESLDGGLRASTLIAEGVKAMDGSNFQVSSIQSLTSAQQMIANGDIDGATKILTSLEHMNMPPEFTAVRQILWAVVYIRQDKLNALLATCDQIEASGADMPMIHQFRAGAYNKLKQYDKALASAQAWKESLGGDLEVYYEMGLALKGLARHDEAATAFGESLDDEPDAINSFKEFATELPESRKMEIANHLNRCKKPKVLFHVVAGVLQRMRKLDTLETFLAAYSETGTEDVWANYYTGELHTLRKQFADSEKALEPIINLAPDATSVDLFNREYLYAAMKAGHSIEGYSKVGDKNKAFRWLTEWLDRNPLDIPAIEKLIAVHEPGNSNDPWLMFWQGEVDSSKRAWADAEGHYKSAWAGATPKDQLRILKSRVFARYQSGRPFTAFADLTPHDQTYRELAKLYVTGHKSDELSGLVAAWRIENPDEPLITFCNAELNYMQGSYPEVVRLLESKKKIFLADSETHTRFLNIEIRSLAKVGQYDDAMKLTEPTEFNAENIDDKAAVKSRHFYIALVDAAAGRVKEAENMIQQCLTEGYTVGDFYTDWLSGPAIRSDAFAAWRKTHADPSAAKTPATRAVKPATHPAL